MALQPNLFHPDRKEKKPNEWVKAEGVTVGYFPNLSEGIEINGNTYRLARNNRTNIYDIDYGIFDNQNTLVGAIDVEHKPEWKHGHYPYWSVARYTWRYNKGEHNHPTETTKVRYFRQNPDLTFWMPVRADYKEAGIVTGRIVIESNLSARRRPNGFARDIVIFEFPKEDLIFCEILETEIEEYVIDKLYQAGAFNNDTDNEV